MQVGQKTPGHPYFNDATWQVAVALSNDYTRVQQVDKIRKGGPVTAAMVRSLFQGLLKSSLFESLPPGDIHWEEVAQEFCDQDAEATPASPQLDGRRIEPEVLEILAKCATEDRVVFLPPMRLDRKLYERVNAVLEDLGGKWNKKLQGHLFDSDPRDALELAVMTGTYIRAKDFGYFPTPAGLAEQLVMLAGLGPMSPKGLRILEPSAGQGAIADAAARWVGVDAIDTIELLDANAAKLREKGYRVQQADFLSVAPRPEYDVVLMNPPFGAQGDMRHVEHAARFLKPDGRLYAIMSPSFQYRSSKQAEEFRSLLAMAGSVEREIESGAFRESGTMVRTVIVKFDAAMLPWNRAERAAHGRAANEEVSEEAGEEVVQRERMRA